MLPEDPSDPRYIACLRLTADVLAEMGLQGEAQRVRGMGSRNDGEFHY